MITRAARARYATKAAIARAMAVARACDAYLHYPHGDLPVGICKALDRLNAKPKAMKAK